MTRMSRFHRSAGALSACMAVLAVTTSVAVAFDGAREKGRSAEYLIVAAQTFAGSAPVTQLAGARTARGFNVTTYSVPIDATAAEIKTYIESWYAPTSDCYVLLVGDSDEGVEQATATTIPHWIGGGWHTSPTDLPYACMDGGDDWYPNLFIGRFAVDTLAELQAVVDKTLFVEAGAFSDPDYTKRAAFLAGEDAGTEAEETHDWVVSNYMDPAGFDSTKIYTTLGGGTADITSAVNAGSLFTVYFGHSSYGGWWDPLYISSYVQALSNDGLYGLVFSLSCGTASFDLSSECFGEVWIREADKGAAAYLSTTDLIWSEPDSAWESMRRLEKYFFESFFVDGIWEASPAWQAALYRLLADPDYGPTHDHTRDYFEMFVLLGDPALLLPHEEVPTGDFDEDGDVDLVDFAAFLTCFSEAATGDCEPGNLAGGGTIDLADYAEFVTVLNGPGA